MKKNEKKLSMQEMIEKLDAAKKANPLDPPIKIEAQKPAKLLLEKRDKRYEDD